MMKSPLRHLTARMVDRSKGLSTMSQFAATRVKCRKRICDSIRGDSGAGRGGWTRFLIRRESPSRLLLDRYGRCLFAELASVSTSRPWHRMPRVRKRDRAVNRTPEARSFSVGQSGGRLYPYVTPKSTSLSFIS